MEFQFNEQNLCHASNGIFNGCTVDRRHLYSVAIYDFLCPLQVSSLWRG